MKTVVYTDGSIKAARMVSDKPVASWAFVFVKRKGSFQKHNSGEVIFWGSGIVCTDPFAKRYIGAEKVTVNSAELSGVYWALYWLVKMECKEAIIFSDSKYSVNVCRGLYTVRKNTKLVHSVRGLLLKSKIKLRWVKAHVGNTFNEMADRFAKEQLRA